MYLVDRNVPFVARALLRRMGDTGAGELADEGAGPGAGRMGETTSKPPAGRSGVTTGPPEGRSGTVGETKAGAGVETRAGSGTEGLVDGLGVNSGDDSGTNVEQILARRCSLRRFSSNSLGVSQLSGRKLESGSLDSTGMR
jgi:hypothetical protein